MPHALPTFSVVIPTRDRPEELVVCLESLAKQNYPRDRFEVVVVDDASKLPLDSVVTAYRERLNLTLVKQPQSAGPSVGRNSGAAHASGEFLAFTDDDCAPTPAWLELLGAHFRSTPHHLIGGHVINALTENLYSTASHVILDVIYDYYDPEKGRAHFFPTSNFALPASQFREIGGFDGNWPLAAGEDREFCYRWLQRGFLMTYAPEVSVYHRHRLTLRSFCQLHFRYGRGAYHYHSSRAVRGGAGGLKPDWRFHLACVQYPFQHMAKRRATIVVALLLLWLCNAAGYFWQRFHLVTRRSSLSV
jgi:GT2 family glycosyltransferase